MSIAFQMVTNYFSVSLLIIFVRQIFKLLPDFQKKIFSGPILSCAVSGNKMAVSSVKSPLKMFDIEEKKIFDEKDVLFPQK